MKVKDVMNAAVFTCQGSAKISEAAQIMWEKNCGIVPVVSADHRLDGVITDRDACMASWTQGLPLHEIPVAVAMCKEPVLCHVDDTVERVHSLMKSRKVHRVVVTEKASGKVVGLVSLADLARHAILPKLSHGGNARRDVAETLAELEGSLGPRAGF